MSLNKPPDFRARILFLVLLPPNPPMDTIMKQSFVYGLSPLLLEKKVI